MRNNQNKHGPDIDIGVWYMALLRHSTEASGDSDAGRTARAGPDGVGIMIPPRKHGEIDARGDPRVSDPAATSCNALERAKAEKRRQKRWRSTIVERRTGESPPGIVKELIMNNIDSTARIRLPARGRLTDGVLMADFGLMGGVCNEVTYDLIEKDKGTRGVGDKGTYRSRAFVETEEDKGTRGDGDKGTYRS